MDLGGILSQEKGGSRLRPWFLQVKSCCVSVFIQLSLPVQ